MVATAFATAPVPQTRMLVALPAAGASGARCATGGGGRGIRGMPNRAAPERPLTVRQAPADRLAETAVLAEHGST